MATIGSLNYKIGTDTSGLTKGMVVTKRELRDGAKLMEASATPAQRYASKLDHLTNLYRKGAIDAHTYQRQVRQLRLEKMTGVPVLGQWASKLANVHPAILAGTAALAAFTIAVMAAKRAVHAMSEAVKEQLGKIDEIAKAARAVGTTAEQLVGLRLAASEFSGLTDQQLDKALKKMTVQLGDAADGTGTAADALDMIGVSFAELAGRDPAEQFKRIAEGVSGLEDATQQAYVAQQLFGRSGVDLLNTLRAGREGIEDVEQAAIDLGLAFSAIEANRVEAANDAVGRAKGLVTGLSRELTVELAPAIQLAAEKFVKALGPDTQFGQSIRELIDIAGPGLALLVDLLEMAVGSLQMVQGKVIGTGAGILTTLEYLDRAKAKLTGGQANQDLAVMADSFRRQHAELLKEAAGNFEFDVFERFKELSGGAGNVDGLTNSARDAGTAIDDANDAAGALNDTLAELPDRLAELEDFDPFADLRDKLLNSFEGRELSQSITRAYDDWQKVVRRGEQLTESVRTPQERLADDLAEYRDLFEQGAIDAETYARAVAKAREEADTPLKDTAFKPLGPINAAVEGSAAAAERVDAYRQMLAQQTGKAAAAGDTEQQTASGEPWHETALKILQGIHDSNQEIAGKDPVTVEEVDR